MYYDEIFICSNQLPKPLSENEVRSLIESMNKGDLKAKDKLIKHNIRLVLYEVTNKFKTVKHDKRDLVSVGNIGLIKAVKSYNIDKNTKFSSYAIRCIDNEILMYLKKIKKNIQILSLDNYFIQNQTRNHIKIQDTLKEDISIIDDYINKETCEIIRDCIDKLPDRDRTIILLYFGFINGRRYTQSEIAEILSISQAYLSVIMPQSINKVKIQLIKSGFYELRTSNLYNDSCINNNQRLIMGRK